MTQGLLPFKYELEKSASGMTSFAGVGLYLDWFKALGLGRLLDRKVGARQGEQGYRDRDIGELLVLLNLVGGESVEDVERLEEDKGLVRMWEKRYRRRGLERRFRRLCGRRLPTASSVFRYLDMFHEKEPEEREEGKAFIPEANRYLRGLREVNRLLAGRVQRLQTESEATLDCDATVARTWKRDAYYCYEGMKAYQPLNILWREQELVLHTEFRDGNVPAIDDGVRVLKESLAMLPVGVKKVLYRSDCAGYQHELMGYMDDMVDDKSDAAKVRFGRMGFAIGCPVKREFKKALRELSQRDWQPLDMDEKGHLLPGGREWAEVCFVPNTIGHKKRGREYRYLATRRALREPFLPGMEEQRELPFPVITWAERQYKVFALATNLEWEGDEIIVWHDQRSGQGEQMHAVLKNELAGGHFPSGKFGANAAWWWFAVLAFNVQSAMKRLVLPVFCKTWRMKAIRFHLLHLPARIVHHANHLSIRLAAKPHTLELILQARLRIASLASILSG
jgi:hypothetical protein